MQQVERTRILHCLGWVSRGGVERRRLMMAEGLDDEKYEHMLLCQEADTELMARFKAAGWEVQVLGLRPSLFSPAWYLRAVRLVQQFRPHIIHGAVFEGQMLAAVLGLWFPRAKVIVEETSDADGRSWRGHLLMAAICRLADLVVGVAPQITAYQRKVLRVPARKIVTLPNGALAPEELSDADRLALRLDLGLSPSDFVLGSTGRLLDRHKRFSDIIRLVPDLARHSPSLKLLIVGDGPDGEYLRNLSEDLCVSDRVIFAGFRSDASTLYRVLDLFVLASSGEALPLVLVEAMLAEVPCVATNVGGVPYVLDNGAVGRLVPPSSPSDLKREISALMKSSQERKRIGVDGRKRANALFSSTAYLERVENLWTNALSPNPTSY